MDRIQMQSLLEKILGSKNVFYQPPSGAKLSRLDYPAIVYSLKRLQHDSADNFPYIRNDAYDVILIHREPDCGVSEELAKLPKCYHERRYTSNNLYHDAFTIYS